MCKPCSGWLLESWLQRHDGGDVQRGPAPPLVATTTTSDSSPNGVYSEDAHARSHARARCTHVQEASGVEFEFHVKAGQVRQRAVQRTGGERPGSRVVYCRRNFIVDVPEFMSMNLPGAKSIALGLTTVSPRCQPHWQITL